VVGLKPRGQSLTGVKRIVKFPSIFTTLIVSLTRGGEGIRTLIDSLATFDSAGERIAALPPHHHSFLANW
jgi:hypothetical protein